MDSIRGGFNLFGMSSRVNGVGIDQPDMKKVPSVVGTVLEEEQHGVVACHIGMRGWRRTMEDAHIMEVNIRGRLPIITDDNASSSSASSASNTPVMPTRSLKSTGGRGGRSSKGKNASVEMLASLRKFDEEEVGASSKSKNNEMNDLLLCVYAGHGGNGVR